MMVWENEGHDASAAAARLARWLISFFSGLFCVHFFFVFMLCFAFVVGGATLI
jgi:hypothetical protein